MMVLDLLKNRTRSQRYRLHKHFLKHSTTLEAIEDQPEMLSKENWMALCAYWSDPKDQERYEINRNNRSKLSVLHNQGSRAFVTLLNELEEKAGKQFDKIEFFPPTHCTDGKWTTSECEIRYKSMLNVQAKSIAEGKSMTPNECYDEVMGVKSGYDKGFGYGPKPPRKTSNSSFSDIISILKPDLVIYDICQPWAAKIASLQGIPAVHFVALSAATASFVYHHYTNWDANFPFQELTLKEDEKKSIDIVTEFLYDNVFEKDKDVGFVNFKLSCDVVLLKTSKALEGKYIDYVTNGCKKVILPVGPLVSDANEIDKDSSEILKWLSMKNKYSTLYISFGSEYFLSKEEIEEIAKGLELCDVNFIWVIRFPIGETVNIEEALPRGFLDRVKERGKILEGWAPQANILAHESTGGFMSHCGWSSINESVYFGVPILGMPMRNDQFINVKMLGEAGVCVEVVRNENEVFKGEEIAKAMNKVISENFNGEEFRRRARELSEEMKIEEAQAIDETTEQLWRLCLKNK
ncbi:hypothetical protein RD792_017170 [Penstemon davidsonii]|uniref:Glycosyltransferase n=1 Tax=Penstemon davidsonii TaxID=160366 RepID=A0ABR0CLV2_9LAMI|nr:hypothetical protein RD792_017170 [Penstemon davidsonii]